LQQTVVQLVQQAIQKANQQGYRVLPIITAGAPGRFIGPDNQIIATGSAANMEKTKGEFDQLNLAASLQKVLPDFCQVIIKNDAIAQFSAGLSSLMQDADFRSKFLGQKLAYIGPGTGLGGGFCEVDQQGAAQYYTDGHIYDLQICDAANTSQKAEDLFSGRAFTTITGKTPKEVNTNPQLLAQFEPQIKLMGLYMARIIQKIYQGDIKKAVPEDAWPAEDCQKVAGTTIYLIGGSLGTKGEMGKIIRQTAIAELSKMNISGIEIIPIPEAENAAIIGAAQFVSATQILQKI
jgi:hypothetical protein